MAALPTRKHPRLSRLATRPAALRRRQLLSGEELEPRRVLDSTVVLSELMYHPTGDNSALEWVELHNQMSVDMDLSGWSLADGIDYTFPAGSILGGGEYLVVAANPASLSAASGSANAVGPFTGQLANGGETIELRDNNARVMDSVTYGDDGAWTPGADGSGASLSKRSIGAASADPQSWSHSTLIGGTPGSENFPDPALQPRVFDTLLSAGAATRVLVPTQAGDLPANWNATAYNDQVAPWLSRTTGVGFDTTGTSTVGPLISAGGNVQTAMAGVNSAAFTRNSFQVTDPAAYDNLKLSIDYDDGFVAYLNGTEVARRNAPAGAPAYNAVAPTLPATAPPATDRVMWLSADAGLSVDGLQNVTGWADANGTSGNWVESVRSDPQLATASFPSGNRPVVRFDGNDGFNLLNDAALRLPSLSIYVVTSIDASSQSAMFLANYRDVSGFGVGISDSTQNRIKWFTASPGNSQEPAIGQLTPEHNYLVTSTFNAGTKELRVRDENGTQTNTTTGASLNYAADTQATLGNLDFGRQYLRGDIAEVLVYSGASAIQQAAVETYLMQKYFGAASAPISGHEEIDLTPYLGSLTTGTNVLAIAGLNTSASDSDFLIRPELIARQVPSNTLPGGQTNLVGPGMPARVLTPTEASQLAATWNTQSFNDQTAPLWFDRTLGVGFGGGEVGPLVDANGGIGPQMSGVNASAFVRTSFQVDDPSDLASLKLNIDYDDGFVAYLNGTEIARSNAPSGTPAFDATATSVAMTASYRAGQDLVTTELASATGANPNGAWTYGASLALGGALIPFPAAGATHTNDWLQNGSPLQGYAGPPLQLPIMVVNTSNTPYSPCCGFSIDPSTIFMHPGNTGTSNFDVVRWTAPGTGTVALSDVAFIQKGGKRAPEYILHNNVAVATGYGTFTPEAFSLHVAAGDTIDFVVGPDMNGADNTGAADDPNGSRSVQFDASLTFSSARLELDITSYLNLLTPGTNVLAIQGLNISAADGDFLVRPQLVAQHNPVEVVANGALVINEVASASSGSFFVEIANHSAAPINLAGFKLSTLGTTSGQYVFGSQVLAPGALVTVSAAQLAGYTPAAGDRVFLTAPGGLQLLDAVTVRTAARGRAAELANDFAFVAAPTPGATNSFVFHNDIVINEIMYHHQPQWTSGPVSAVDSNEEWVELYNRGSQSVDLGGWRFDENIDFVFPVGTTLGAGQYLVVARNAAALQLQYPAITVLGNYSGSLPNSGGNVVLKDAQGNVADQVDYLDSGRWASAADGGGSSLELRDPDSNNALPEAWGASDESGKSTWQTYTYTGIATVNAGPVQWNEFVLGLLDSGEVLLDDIHVIQAPSTVPVELIQNSGFETTLNKWRVLGNHHGSVIVDPTNAANHVLRLTASGVTDAMYNHAETTLAGNVPIVAGREYQISFRAKWVSGSPQVNSRLYFNWLPKTTIIDVPQLNGTPGAVNSRYQANIGPAYQNLVQGPVVPAAGEPVKIAVDVADPDGVASALLFWKPDGGSWSSVSMTAGAGGRYEGTIPGQPSATIVQFYVQATDSLGAVSTFPAAGANARALYKVQDGQASNSGLHSVRIITTAADATFLHTNTNIMSNDLVGATVIYDESEIYYNVGVRLKGSVYGRSLPERLGYVVEFNSDHLFRGVQSQIALDRSGIGQVGVGGHEEIVAQQFLHHAGDVPAEYDDMVQLIAPLGQFNHTALLAMSRFGNDYLDSQFSDGSDGTQFDLELFYYTTTTTDGNPESLKTWSAGPYVQNEIKDYGPDKEQYRNQFLIKNNRAQDDYQRLMQVAQAFSLTGAALDTATQELLDVDQWMRVFASQSLLGNLDSYSLGLPHNLFLYVRPEDQKVLAMPHDLDQAFVVAVNAPLSGGGNLAKLIAIPANQRLYWGHLQNLINTTYNTQYMGYWTSHYGGLVGQNYGGVLNYIGQRGNYVLSQLPAAVPFQITTNGGADFTTPNSSITIGGDAWLNVKQIFIEGRSQPLELTWSDTDSWQATISLASGANTLKFQAYDFEGLPLTFDTITVTSTAVAYTQFDNLRITELMYNPAATAGDAPYTSSDFEFIELQNIGAQPLDLSGAKISGGVDYTFATQILAPGARVLIVNTLAAMTQRYGAGLPIAGEFSGNLNNSGEPIVLEDSLGQTILNFTYLPAWVPTTNGTGPSLVIKDAGAATATWNSAASWQASSQNGGSPGLAEPAGSVVSRQLFYNNSTFDGNNAAAGAADDAAIATNKSALLPGGTATAAHYTSYSRGINGLMIDVSGMTLPLTIANFAFRVGNDDTPGSWANGPVPASIDVRTGAGVGGSDRVTLIWPDGAILKTWLQVTVSGSGLSTPDVFYFGNAVGESGDSITQATVNATDEVAARNNPRTFLSPADVTNAYDYNRDGFVNATDQILARSNSTTLAASLKLIHPPASLAAAALALAQASPQIAGLAMPNDAAAVDTSVIAAGLSSPSRTASNLPATTSPTAAPQLVFAAPELFEAFLSDDFAAGASLNVADADIYGSHASDSADEFDDELFELLAAVQVGGK